MKIRIAYDIINECALKDVYMSVNDDYGFVRICDVLRCRGGEERSIQKCIFGSIAANLFSSI